MILRRLAGLTLLTGLCSAAALPAHAEPGAVKDILRQIPADAWGFVAIPNLKANLDEKVNLISQTLGMTLPPVTMMAAGQFGLTEGLNATGGFAIVAMEVKELGQKGQVMIIPASDGDAIIRTLSETEDEESGDKGGGEERDEQVAGPKTKGPERKSAADDAGAEADEAGLVRGKLMGQDVFLAKKGGYVLLGGSKKACSAVLKAKKSLAETIEKPRLALFSKSDIIISLAAHVWIDAFRDQLKGIVGMMAMMSPEAGQVTEQIESFIETLGDVTSADLCVTIAKSGVSLCAMATPRSGCEWAKTLKKATPRVESLLVGLPKDRFMLAVGYMTTESATLEKDTKDVAEKIVSALKLKEKVNKEKLDELAGLMALGGKMTRQQAFSCSALPEGPDGIIAAAAVSKVNDSEEARKLIGRMVSIWKDLSGDEEFKPYADLVEYQEAAETIAGTKVDHLRLNLKALVDSGEMDEEDLETLGKLLGPDGLLMRYGSVGGEQTVMTVGGGKAYFEKFVEAVKKGSEGLDADRSIAGVSKQLPEKKTGEMYLALDAILDCVQRVMTAMGEDEAIPFKLSQVNAPVGGSMTIDGGSGRMDLFVPMELVTAFKDAYMSSMAGEDDMEDEEGFEEEEDAAEPAAGKKSAPEDEDEE